MWLQHVKHLLEYRAHMIERFGRLPSEMRTRLGAMNRRPVWIQAVSVGEVILARRLIEALGAECSGGEGPIPTVLSSTTPAGRDLASTINPPGLGGVFHFPIDWPPFVRHSFSTLNPCAFISIETEIWPVLLGECARRGVPALIVNGRISERSHGRYLRLGAFLRGPLQAVQFACMQSEADANRIKSLGLPAERVVVTGNMKFDIISHQRPPADLGRLYAKAGSRPILVAGSTSEGEEAQVLDALARIHHHDILLILAPRHRARFDRVAQILRRRGEPFVRRSHPGPGTDRPPRILLMDTVGELAQAYSMATVAFVGGSLVPRGGQNLVEPAACGIPVLFGPHTHNFQMVAEALVAGGAGFRVDGPATLARVIQGLLDDPAARQRAGLQAQRLVEQNRGATAMTIRHILPFIAA